MNHIISLSQIKTLKRTATKLKKAENISHTEALDIVSKEAGFLNWHNFINSSISDIFVSVAEYRTAQLSEYLIRFGFDYYHGLLVDDVIFAHGSFTREKLDFNTVFFYASSIKIKDINEIKKYLLELFNNTHVKVSLFQMSPKHYKPSPSGMGVNIPDEELDFDDFYSGITDN